MRTKIMTLIALTLLVAPIAFAGVGDDDKPLISITPYLGGGFWAADTGLKDSFLFGARGALHLTGALSVEGTYGRSGAEREVDGAEVDLDHYGLDLVWELNPDAKWNPYLSAGWAQLDHDLSGTAGTEVLNGVGVGIGLKTRLGGDNANYRALRFEVKDVISNLTPAFPNDDDPTHNLIATVGMQFAFGGSSRDSDGDGVRDRDDACADTPSGASVDGTGCPTDSDGDGVLDGLDGCADTPAGATVDAAGCPSDSDGDGVLDGIDRCADTPSGAVIDGHGCPVDSDGDGVFDGIDQCADTPANLQVDAVGCPIAVTETEVQLLDTGSITTNSIVFASGSSAIDVAASPVLAEIGEVLVRWPSLKLGIIGHTDDTGSAAFNQKLSEQRAAAVLDHLRRAHPDLDLSGFTASGRGEGSPVADNTTAEGRQANRRVEFKVLNPDELKRVIEHRKHLER